MIGVFVQARLNSERLKYKMIRPIYGDKKIIDIALEAAKEIPADYYVLLCPDEDRKFFLESAQKNKFDIIEGSEKNVLSRFILALKKYKNIDYVVRVCADKMVIANEYQKELINQSKDYDITFYTGQPLENSTSEVYRATSLIKAEMISGDKPLCFEHIKPCFLQDFWNINVLPIPEQLKNKSLNLVIDTIEDYFKAKEVFAKIYKNKPITLEEAIEYFEENT